MNYLYHGSKKQGLTGLETFDGGHKKSYVYAVSQEAFAAIFINRIGGSLVASWGRLDDGMPYYCERKKNVFDNNYSNEKGSIYVVNGSLFKHKDFLWKEEYISKQKIKPIKEIKIKNVKKYLLGLEAEGKVKIIYFKDRKKYFPKIDDDILKTAERLVDKYGYEKVISSIKKYQPQIVSKLNNR